MSRSLSRLLNRMKRGRAAAPPFDRRRQTGICFFYGLGDADAFRDRLRNVLVGIVRSRLAVDDPASATRPLLKRPGWRRTMRTLEPGDVVFLIDAIALGPTWRLHDRTFEQMAKLKARVVVVLSDHSTIDLSAGPGNDELERIRQEALDEYHRQRIRDGLAVARAAGKRVGRPPFGWPCRDGQVVPPAADLETIGEICRRVEHHETLRAIHADLLCRRIRRADGERWTLPAVSAAFRYGIGLGWASRRRRPWDFVKGRVACRA